jgi:thiamine pyrophosphate-dependent acetolactate synthase large subunit-like protein
MCRLSHFIQKSFKFGKNKKMSDVSVLRSQVKEFVNTASEKELELMYRFFDVENKDDWWNEITEDQKKSINKGLAQLNNGEGVPHKEVMKKYAKWLKK